MHKLSTILLFAIFTFASCKSLDDVRTKNRESLMKLSRDMSKQEVLDMMGTETQKTYAGDFTVPTGKINNPYRIEMYEAADSIWEILYYYTDKKADDGAITDDELTPIVLRDNELVGFGWSYWEDQIRKFEIRVR